MSNWLKSSVCADKVSDVDPNSIDSTSHYSLSNNILPSLGARSTRGVILRRFTVSPFDPRYRYFFRVLTLYKH